MLWLFYFYYDIKKNIKRVKGLREIKQSDSNKMYLTIHSYLIDFN